MTDRFRVMQRLVPLAVALALALALFPFDGGHSTAYAQTPQVVGVAPVPPSGGRTLVTAGTADIQTLIDAQQFVVESVWLFDVQAQQFLSFVVGAPTFANSLTSISPTDIVTLKAAPSSPINPSPVPIKAQVEGLTDPAQSYLASIGWAESEAAAIAWLARQSTVVVRTTENLGGSGWVAAPGYVVTNDHVVLGVGTTLTIITIDGTSYSATVVATLPTMPSGQQYDLALLEVSDPTGLPAAMPLGVAEVGDPVLAIGHPSTLGKWVVSVGQVTDANFAENKVLADVAIAPGSSGGPVVNRLGEVIGVASGTKVPALTVYEVFEKLIIRSISPNLEPGTSILQQADGVRQLLEEYGVLPQ
ncbi:MAG: serine protease [Dehalococcoidia bacterium]